MGIGEALAKVLSAKNKEERKLAEKEFKQEQDKLTKEMDKQGIKLTWE